jgi:uncharacterized protein (UPF0333 family)
MKFKDFLLDNKAQGALEYLLILAAAVIIAAIVIAFLSNIVPEAKTEAQEGLDSIFDVVN